MGKMKQSFDMTKNIFREECRDKRVIMGYVLGIAIFGYWLHVFLQYVWDTGEPMNILEAFIVIENHNINMLLLIIGWILIISDAPFIKGNIYLILYRSSRMRWNMGMMFYIMLQALLYVFCIAVVSVVVSSFWGFSGNMWSSPVYDLAMDEVNNLGVEYNITFHWTNMMRNLTVPQAFGITFLFMWLYLVFCGILLYVCNLLLKEIYGILLVCGIQIWSFLMQTSEVLGFSLLAKSMPGYSIDGRGGQWKTVFLFAGMILSLVIISLWMVKCVDFKDAVEEE